jgi:hypothetical protein
MEGRKEVSGPFELAEEIDHSWKEKKTNKIKVPRKQKCVSMCQETETHGAEKPCKFTVDQTTL